MGERDLELGLDGRQRAAQLVGGVGDEVALPDRRGVQPAQQLVHGPGQLGVVAAGQLALQPPAEAVAADDLGGLRADRLHRPQRPGVQQPGHRPHQQDERGEAEPHAGAHALGRRLGAGQRADHVHGPGSPRRARVCAHQQVRPGVGARRAGGGGHARPGDGPGRELRQARDLHARVAVARLAVRQRPDPPQRRAGGHHRPPLVHHLGQRRAGGQRQFLRQAALAHHRGQPQRVGALRGEEAVVEPALLRVQQPHSDRCQQDRHHRHRDQRRLRPRRPQRRRDPPSHRSRRGGSRPRGRSRSRGGRTAGRPCGAGIPRRPPRCWNRCRTRSPRPRRGSRAWSAPHRGGG